MNKRAKEQTDQTHIVNLLPSFIWTQKTWQEARALLQTEPTREHLAAYCKASDELAQEFALWKSLQPSLFEQLRFWLHSHEGDAGEMSPESVSVHLRDQLK